LALLTGFIFFCFTTEKSITGGDGAGAADEIGFGDKAMVTLPSGPYFLGLPLFFFNDIVAAAGDGWGGGACGGACGGAGGTDPGVEFGLLSDLGAIW
jgi:hypothetical protein